ncbi:MAG: hypothetical protein R2739_05170 [Chitinophagales bacterium]|nr:hypothetical protein [Bacteroidota bacterium]
MQKNYSTLLIPENSTGLLFSIVSNNYIYHCWKSPKEAMFVVVKESSNTRNVQPNQLMNFTETALKRYLYIATNKLQNIEQCLFFNEDLWNEVI